MSRRQHVIHETRTRQGALADLPAAEQVSEVRRLLEGLHGQVWDDREVLRDFEVRYFYEYLAYVTRRVDGQRGTLQRHESAGLYYGWRADRRE
jgi:hypothetical protein